MTANTNSKIKHGLTSTRPDEIHVEPAPVSTQQDSTVVLDCDIQTESVTPAAFKRPACLGRFKSVLEQGPESFFADRELLEGLAYVAVSDKAEYAILRSAVRSAGFKIRDFDAALKPFVGSVTKSIRGSTSRGATGGYFEQAGCICRSRQTSDGPETVDLCNFTAHIVDETVRDDGAEKSTVLGIQGTLSSGRELPRIEVPSEAFDSLSWVLQYWGADAIVWPGESRNLPSAIQALSLTGKQRRTVYTHVGWTKVNDTEVGYVHAGGIITVAKNIDGVSVALDGKLAGYSLSLATSPFDIRTAVKESLRILDVLPDHIGFPLLAGVYRAAFSECDFSLFFAGRTGTGKSEVAALAQQHFGAGMTARALPESWMSTYNALEYMAFLAKDALLVVDDFNPTGSAADIQRFHRDADRLLRGQGNNAGRQRMRADCSLRPAKPPRGLILSTGEDIPKGHSLRARMLIVEFNPGDFNLTDLTPLQDSARRGRYATSMASYLQWIADDYTEIQRSGRTLVEHWRAKVVDGEQHGRTASVVAELTAGFQMFLRFAERCGAITAIQSKSLLNRCRTALVRAAQLQTDFQRSSDPVQQFQQMLKAVVSSGRGHLASELGSQPRNPQSWGWREKTWGSEENARRDWQPQGNRIGWVVGGNLYLEPDASFAEVQRMAREQGETLPLTSQTLWKRLSEKGHLASTAKNRGTLKIRVMLEGHRHSVLHVQPGFFDEPQHSDTPTPED